ncbi:hypothetical protein [Alkalicoccobacillus plakortidis]|uniref:Uncharacterized protein n=1 Tax=Alkalicoccobacillus plakortidis TaxID=444060 RepID=A0ABT0XN42_9BACI|nr:hypothetical protein [Alkalicoccobacillus plakortidis]MCM2677315.1 hypothetical protein [Alkalicoccobacillus plakortidis]
MKPAIRYLVRTFLLVFILYGSYRAIKNLIGYSVLDWQDLLAEVLVFTTVVAVLLTLFTNSKDYK